MVVAFFLSSAMFEDKSLTAGSTAPVIETTEGLIVGDDENSHDKTIIINFWNPKNPSSRIVNRELSSLYGNGKDENYRFISICTDPDETLMNEVMRIDGINPDNNFSYSKISPRVFKDYGVENASATYKISSDSKILEKF